MSDRPSMDHLERHQRDVETYKENVSRSAQSRFGGVWWGVWEEHVVVAPGARIVDLGAGSGELLAQLRARYPEASLVGVELHPTMLAAARARLEGVDVTLVEADLATRVPIEDASADVVVSSLSFHELPYPPDLLANAARVLKPSGTLVLFDVVKQPVEAYMAGREVTRDTLDHFREHCLFTPQDLAWLTTQAGFEVREVLERHGGRFATVIAARA